MSSDASVASLYPYAPYALPLIAAITCGPTSMSPHPIFRPPPRASGRSRRRACPRAAAAVPRYWRPRPCGSTKPHTGSAGASRFNGPRWGGHANRRTARRSDGGADRRIGFDPFDRIATAALFFAAADDRQRPLVTGTQTDQIVGIFVGISARHIELLL